MKFMCVKNMKPGFTGYNHSDDFDVGKEYTFFVHEHSILVFNKKNQWVRVYCNDFTDMFVPV